MEKELVLFSGGKDSFLTALKGIQNNHHVVLVTYTNGCIQGMDNAIRTAQILFDKYGPEYVTILGEKSCIKEFQAIRDLYIETPIRKLYENYPDLLINQINCISCRSAMYVNAIKYCIKHKIKIISEGARKSQPYLVQKNLIISQFSNICERYEIKLNIPVFEIDNDYAVKLEITSFDISYAKTYEVQCWMGVPEGNIPTDKQEKSILDFF